MISVRVLGEISEDKAETKGVTEKLNIGLNSPLIRSKVVISVRVLGEISEDKAKTKGVTEK